MRPIVGSIVMHNRKSIRLRDYDYSQEGGYFITICTHKHECILAEVIDGELRLSEFGEIVLKRWNEIPKQFPNADMDEFVVMPNHIHGI